MKNFLLVIMSLASVSSYAGVSANVSFTTDYIWRGMTQSDGPAVQGGFDYEADSGFYAGFWGSDYPDSDPDLKFEEIYLGFSIGDLGLTYASGQDEAPDYIEVSYGIGPVSISYGDYDEYGENTLISYGFACGSYECGISLYDFSDAGYGADEDGVFFSISASL